MIPKIIHYCWFGGNPLPLKAKECIDSWRKYLPEFEIKEWNESNFDINCCDYVKEAYESKKWAFVSDYARFWIVYKYGGVYFDTDVEMIRPINDILETGAFMGLEKSESVKVAPGLGIAANPGLDIYKEILDAYEEMHFKNVDGSLNKTTVVIYITKIFKQHGLVNTDKIQNIDDITIYPTDFFCPKDYTTGVLTITQNTRTIHHFSASWHNATEKYAHFLSKKLMKYLPLNLSNNIALSIAIIKFEGVCIFLNKIIKKVNKLIVKSS